MREVRDHFTDTASNGQCSAGHAVILLGGGACAYWGQRRQREPQSSKLGHIAERSLPIRLGSDTMHKGLGQRAKRWSGIWPGALPGEGRGLNAE